MSVNILIADDSAIFRSSLRSFIEAHSGWQVCGEAENGAIAVERVAALNPDVVILDWRMPVMNGIEAARLIARIAPKAAILMLTLHSCAELSKQAQAVGIQRVFSKAGSLTDLIASLRNASSGS